MEERRRRERPGNDVAVVCSPLIISPSCLFIANSSVNKPGQGGTHGDPSVRVRPDTSPLPLLSAQVWSEDIVNGM